MEVFAREDAAQGLAPWTLADVTAPAQATASTAPP